MTADKAKKSVQFSDEIKKEEIKDEVVEINESKIDRLLHLLHEANPEDPTQDSNEMLQLESQVNQMLPLIDTELERVDRKHAQLTQLSSDLVEAMNLYHTLMREPDRSVNPYMNYPNSHPMYANAAMSGMFMPNMYQLPHNHPGAMPTLGKLNLTLSERHSHNKKLVSGQHMHMTHGFPIGGPPHQSVPPHLQNGHQVPNMMIPPNSQEQHMQIPGNPQQLQQQHQNIQQQQMQSINPQHLSQEQIQLMQQRQSQMSPQQQPQQMNLPHQQQQPQQIPNHQTQSNPPNQANIPNSQPQLQHSGNFPPQNFPINMPSHMNMPPQNNQSNHPFMQNHQMIPSLQQTMPQSQMHPSPIHNNMLPLNMAINQPVTSTILPSNDSRTNIPVYQQQR